MNAFVNMHYEKRSRLKAICRGMGLESERFSVG